MLFLELKPYAKFVFTFNYWRHEYLRGWGNIAKKGAQFKTSPHACMGEATYCLEYWSVHPQKRLVVCVWPDCVDQVNINHGLITCGELGPYCLWEEKQKNQSYVTLTLFFEPAGRPGFLARVGLTTSTLTKFWSSTAWSTFVSTVASILVYFCF